MLLYQLYNCHDFSCMHIKLLVHNPHSLICVTLLISRHADTVPDIILLVNNVLREVDSNSQKDKHCPLPSERVDGHTLFTVSYCTLTA